MEKSLSHVILREAKNLGNQLVDTAHVRFLASLTMTCPLSFLMANQ